MSAMIGNWICPNCNEALESAGGSLVCVNGHTFDVAREGYVNLLTGRQRSGHKGDTPEMLAARRRFFAGGYYEPLRQRLVSLVAGLKPRVVAEIGCGEGYYIGGIREHVPGVAAFATDIAKEGVRLGAKQYPRVHFAVADTNRSLPLANGSADVVLDVFAPRNGPEFARILRRDGRLVVVIPTTRHLAELREIQPLLVIQEDKRRLVEEGLAGEFKLAQHEVLTAPLELAGPAVLDLVEMTPNAWFLTPEQKQRLGEVGRIRVRGEFEILMFERK
ncbi:MAG: methyltransferase protein [Patescibacteria group bacterium]|nr:methyltransferase protein [Patescibacteria group bacterium]